MIIVEIKLALIVVVLSFLVMHESITKKIELVPADLRRLNSLIESSSKTPTTKKIPSTSDSFGTISS
jgi:hypothetical protein